MDEKYEIIRIVSNYIHNEDQLSFDMFKTKRIVKDIKNIGQDAILKYNNDLYVFEIKNSPTNSATKQVKNHCDKLNISKYITLNGEEGNVNNICFDFVRDVSCISSYIYEGLYKEYKKEKQNN